jgi:hypothetical protein
MSIVHPQRAFSVWGHFCCTTFVFSIIHLSQSDQSSLERTLQYLTGYSPPPCWRWSQQVNLKFWGFLLIMDSVIRKTNSWIHKFKHTTLSSYSSGFPFSWIPHSCTPWLNIIPDSFLKMISFQSFMYYLSPWLWSPRMLWFFDEALSVVG